MHGDGRVLVEGVPQGSVERAFVLHPDPWPKKRHWERRIIQPAMMDALARAIRPGGELRLATDHADYAEREQHKGRRRANNAQNTATLAADPKVILLDEPFAGIDPIAIEDIKNVLTKLLKRDIGILITDHNVRETLEICNKAAIISDGKVIAEGNKESLISNEIVKKVYLGNMYK